jgi:type IV pilus assembly protein PilV
MQRGFSLIEVLVSIFVVSLGILALAGLLQSASRFGKMSELRSTATLMANDIADHVRANIAGATGLAYNVTGQFPATTAVDGRTTPNDTCGATGPVCSPAELAAVDLYFWSSRLLVTLPGGTPYIQYHKAVGATQTDSVDVWVAWTDPNTSASGATERPATECPSGLQVDASPSVRCVYLQVGL